MFRQFVNIDINFEKLIALQARENATKVVSTVPNISVAKCKRLGKNPILVGKSFKRESKKMQPQLILNRTK